MEEKTRELLLEAINHWKKNEEIAARKDFVWDQLDVSPFSCPLCLEFNHSIVDSSPGARQASCIKCPVYQFTNQQFCYGTPISNIDNLREHLDDSEEGSDRFLSFTKKLINQVTKEREFLVDLLPENSPE